MMDFRDKRPYPDWETKKDIPPTKVTSEHEPDGQWYECPSCGIWVLRKFNKCVNCGARTRS